MSDMVRDDQVKIQSSDENLSYMSDMAIELAQMAEVSGLATLAYLFRMAALEALTVHDGLAGSDDEARQATSH